MIAGLFMMLVLAFERARDALLVMLNLPLALIGGWPACSLSGGVLSVASMIGFITLFGIATRNGIMLVSHIHHLMNEEGVTDFPRGGRTRSPRAARADSDDGDGGRAGADSAGARGGGKTGSEIQTPMAIVILCGLMTSTLLNMIVVPTLSPRFRAPPHDDGATPKSPRNPAAYREPRPPGFPPPPAPPSPERRRETGPFLRGGLIFLGQAPGENPLLCAGAGGRISVGAIGTA